MSDIVRAVLLPDDVDPENLYVVFNFAEENWYQLEAKTLTLEKTVLCGRTGRQLYREVSSQ